MKNRRYFKPSQLCERKSYNNLRYDLILKREASALTAR